MSRTLEMHPWYGEPAFAHGGPDATGAARHDFSTNGNACGPCPQALHALAMANATRYPDPAYAALRDRLAAFHGVAPERVVMAASASEFIFRITAAVARNGGRSVDLPSHAYGDYAKAARAWGLACGADIAAPSLVWRCDPSSPLGQSAHDLPRTVDALAPSAMCVLDLAYEPLRLDSLLGLDTSRLDRTWQLWTPNKALGLTGVRAAYAIAPVDAGPLLAIVREMAPSWPVGAHGVALLECWVDRAARDWLLESLETLRGWRERQRHLCDELGWTVRPSVANFFCVAFAEIDAPGLEPALRERDIKLRNASSFGLEGWWRMAVLPPESQDALVEAVKAARHETTG